MARRMTRDEAILFLLRFAYETKLDRLRLPGREKLLRQIFRALFRHVKESMENLLPYPIKLEQAQAIVKDFFEKYFTPFLPQSKENKKFQFFMDAYRPSRFIGVFAHPVHPGEYFMLAQEEVHGIKETIENCLFNLLSEEIIPRSRFFRCEECSKWVLNKRKTRKHWYCSSRCYYKAYRRKERATPEGRERYRKMQREYYRRKVLNS